ncbi:hypothetical protein KJ765_01640 [Candidatus Micrarchaeota archaeon]|nr:hypothetical protein [Candidatus Micrarchaeota archaeon]
MPDRFKEDVLRAIRSDTKMMEQFRSAQANLRGKRGLNRSGILIDQVADMARRFGDGNVREDIATAIQRYRDRVRSERLGRSLRPHRPFEAQVEQSLDHLEFMVEERNALKEKQRERKRPRK